VQVTNEWSCTSTSKCAFMVCTETASPLHVDGLQVYLRLLSSLILLTFFFKLCKFPGQMNVALDIKMPVTLLLSWLASSLCQSLELCYMLLHGVCMCYRC
jgi:hypothetical protein